MQRCGGAFALSKPSDWLSLQLSKGPPASLQRAIKCLIVSKIFTNQKARSPNDSFACFSSRCNGNSYVIYKMIGITAATDFAGFEIQPTMNQMNAYRFSAASAALLLLAVSRVTAGVAYTNGPTNGTLSASEINGGWSESDTFTVSADTALSSAAVGLWVPASEGLPTGLDWSMGTSLGGDELSSGAASLTGGTQLTPADSYGFEGDYSVYDFTFAISSPELDAGTTYYLTLSNGTTSADGGDLFWDLNGSTTSTATGLDNGYTYSRVSGNAFTLYAATSSSSVPEQSSTCLLLVFGLLSLIAVARGISQQRSHSLLG
jgi:hypothetical protein